MSKHFYFIHGLGGRADGGFRPWLKEELEKAGHQVTSLSMPDTDNPKIEAWVSHLQEQIENPDENTVLIGHSLGCSASLRYLERLPEGQMVGKFISVAGFIDKATSLLETAPEELTEWLNTPIDAKKAVASVKEMVGFFSDNDRSIPVESAEVVKEKYGARVIVESGMGHYNGSSGISEVPLVLEEALRP